MTIEKLPFNVQIERVNLTIGLIALMLPIWLLLVRYLLDFPFLASMSHYYYTPIAGDVFVGSLLTIGTIFLFVYRVEKTNHRLWLLDVILARVAGIMAMLVAYFPTSGSGAILENARIRAFVSLANGSAEYIEQDGQIEGVIGFDFWSLFDIDIFAVSMVHYGAALGLYAILFYFCLFVFTRPLSPYSVEPDGTLGAIKTLRNRIYSCCAMMILMSVTALVTKFFVIQVPHPSALWWNSWHLTFTFEAIGMMAFGIAWCVKGRLFGWQSIASLNVIAHRV
jgi:hypothetical protein